MKKWERFLNGGDLAGIVKLYSRDAVLWGTFSQVIRDRPELIREYYEALFEKNLLKVEFGLIRSRICNGVFLHSGTYEFSWLDGKRVTCPARCTFVTVHEKELGHRILQHHSSLIPNNP